MKKILLSVILMVCMATTAWGLPYTGSINSNSGGGLIAGDGWSDGDFSSPLEADATLSWVVSYDDQLLLWTYEYTFTVDEAGISHMIFELSDNFTSANIYPGTTPFDEDGGIGTYDENNGNPEIPGSMYGAKWNNVDPGPGLTVAITIVSNREPMWGDFYAKDGKHEGIWAYAYNTGFGVDTDALIGDGNAMNADGQAWVLVPDTYPIPEPATLLLLGTGLVGVAGLTRKRFKK